MNTKNVPFFALCRRARVSRVSSHLVRDRPLSLREHHAHAYIRTPTHIVCTTRVKYNIERLNASAGAPPLCLIITQTLCTQCLQILHTLYRACEHACAKQNMCVNNTHGATSHSGAHETSLYSSLYGGTMKIKHAHVYMCALKSIFVCLRHGCIVAKSPSERPTT